MIRRSSTRRLAKANIHLPAKGGSASITIIRLRRLYVIQGIVAGAAWNAKKIAPPWLSDSLVSPLPAAGRGGLDGSGILAVAAWSTKNFSAPPWLSALYSVQ